MACILIQARENDLATSLIGKINFDRVKQTWTENDAVNRKQI